MTDKETLDAIGKALAAELDGLLLDPTWDGTWSADQKQRVADYNNARRRLRKRATYVKSKYGLDRPIYAEMGKRQEHRCATCNRHESEFKHGLSIDHDHVTGKVRGLLCQGCNAALGHAKENPEVLKLLAAYLMFHNRET